MDIVAGTLAEIDHQPQPWICWARDPVTVRFLRHKSHHGWPVYPPPRSWPLFSRLAVAKIIEEFSRYPGDRRIAYTGGRVPHDLGHPVVVKPGDEHRNQGFQLLYPGDPVEQPAVLERYWQGETWRVLWTGEIGSVWRLIPDTSPQLILEHSVLSELTADAKRLKDHWDLPILAAEYQVDGDRVMCTDIDVRPPCPPDEEIQRAGTRALLTVIQQWREEVGF